MKLPDSLRYILCFLLHLSLYPATFSQDEAFFRGDLSTPNGSENCNPCVDNVIDAVYTLRNYGTTLGFHMGANYPEVKGAGTQSHWQGIQRLPMMGMEVPYLVVSSSHRDFALTLDGEIVQLSGPAHFAVVQMGSRGDDGRRLRSNRLEFGKLTRNVPPHSSDLIVRAHAITMDYDHPGGMQAIGNYLLVGCDGNINHSRNTALFTLWDMSLPLKPREVWTDPKWELSQQNANSVGIVRLQDGRYLMLRALSHAKELEFYILSDNLEESPGSYHDGTPWDHWHYSELQSELQRPDGSFDREWADLGSFFGDAGYQNTNLVTECGTGKLYLVATHGRRPESFGGDDFVDLYRVDVPVQRPDANAPGEGVIVTKVAARHMFPGNNAGARQADLQAAAGSYVSPNNKLYVYATEHGVTGPDKSVHMIEFGPAKPLSQVESIDEAWVELYDREDFDGRSIILDYTDRHLRDYGNFRNIESFEDTPSSAIYAIPVGYTLRLYEDPDLNGGHMDLVGTGRVNEIADFSNANLSNEKTANNQISSAEWLSDGTVTKVSGQEEAALPFQLFQNYPNPFNAETVISYQLDKEASVRVEIYDIRGQLIKTLVFERQSPGFYSVRWDGRDELGNDVASGTYLYRLEMEEFVKVRTLTLVR